MSIDFAASLLPSKGFVCVGEITPKGTFQNFWPDSPIKAVELARELDTAGRTVFVAQGSFANKGTDWTGRGGNNVSHFRNFFLDIDCGKEKPYPDQKAGLAALFSFCKKTDLPIPSVVSSGWGMYAYWRLDKDLPVSLWHPLAVLLSKLVKAHEPGLDKDGICADRARVLRPVGTTNRKREPQPVRVVFARPLIDPVELGGLLKAAAAKIKIHLPAPKENVVKNAAFTGGLETERPSHAGVIAQKCAQVTLMQDSGGDVPEPLWYALIGLLRHTVEAPEIIHEWSMGHEDYTPEATDKKISQHEQAGAGPTTCAHLHKVNPGVCDGCRHAEKTISPITLGYEELKLAVQTEEGEAIPEPPQGWKLTEQGVIYCDGDEERIVYPYLLWVSSVNADHFGESFTVRHRLPKDGWKEFTAASNKICEQKALTSVMVDNHIGVIGKDNKGLFMVYIETFMAKLRAQQSISKLSGQMGWGSTAFGKYAFVHGSEVYYEDGTTTKGGYSVTAPDFVRSMCPVGDTTEWVEKTAILNRKGLEGLAFEFLCGAFGAPLVKFTGFEGAALAAVGPSGVGKTLVGKWGLSAWGDPKKLMLMRDDTRNMLVSRLGVYNTLPAYIDEITNIEPKELSDIVYKITQGRDKGRMTKAAIERKDINGWNTLAIVSSNSSLMDKLTSYKGDAGAELNRIFEFLVTEGVTMDEGREIAEVIEANYGAVGRQYAQYLVINQSKHRKALNKISQMLVKKAEIQGEERFWAMTGAVAIYGGMIAQKLRISRVEVEPMIDWIVAAIKNMRKYKSQEVFNPVSFLGALLDKHANGALVVSKFDLKDKFDQRGYREPRTQLVYRIELDRKRLWISSDIVQQELTRIHISPKKVADILMDKGIMTGRARINLGRGTIFTSINQFAWEIDLTHPDLGYVALQVMPAKEELKKEVVG